MTWILTQSIAPFTPSDTAWPGIEPARAITLPETRIYNAVTFAERVRLAVAETNPDRNEERVTLTIGVAEWRDGDDSLRRLIAEADQALLKAKGEGRNHVVANRLV